MALRWEVPIRRDVLTQPKDRQVMHAQMGEGNVDAEEPSSMLKIARKAEDLHK